MGAAGSLPGYRNIEPWCSPRTALYIASLVSLRAPACACSCSLAALLRLAPFLASGPFYKKPLRAGFPAVQYGLVPPMVVAVPHHNGLLDPNDDAVGCPPRAVVGRAEVTPLRVCMEYIGGCPGRAYPVRVAEGRGQEAQKGRVCHVVVLDFSRLCPS